MMKSHTSSWALLLGGALLAPVVLADSYTFGPAAGQSVTIYQGTTSIGTSAGIFKMSAGTSYNASTAFDVFCVDINGPINWGETVNFSLGSIETAPVGAGETAMGANRAKLINALIDLYYAPAKLNATTAANLQLAIWDVVVASSSSSLFLDVTKSANPALTSGTIYNMLTAASAVSNPNNHIALLSSSKQDFAIVPVPDGGMTLALLGLGVGGLSFMARRRE